jgi:hypothetical protein
MHISTALCLYLQSYNHRVFDICAAACFLVTSCAVNTHSLLLVQLLLLTEVLIVCYVVLLAKAANASVLTSTSSSNSNAIVVTIARMHYCYSRLSLLLSLVLFITTAG